MKEIKVAKHSKQWCKTRMTTSAIVSIISFCITVLITPNRNLVERLNK